MLLGHLLVKLFRLAVLAASDVSYSGELVSRVRILNAETVLELLGPLVEILSIEGVIRVVILTEGHIEALIPFGRLPAGGHVAASVAVLPPPLRLRPVRVKGPRIR